MNPLHLWSCQFEISNSHASFWATGKSNHLPAFGASLGTWKAFPRDAQWEALRRPRKSLAGWMSPIPPITWDSCWEAVYSIISPYLPIYTSKNSWTDWRGTLNKNIPKQDELSSSSCLITAMKAFWFFQDGQTSSSFPFCISLAKKGGTPCPDHGLWKQGPYSQQKPAFKLWDFGGQNYSD